MDSSFVDKDHRHIVTEDLRIVGNNKLRKLFTKSPKYIEANNNSWKKAKSANCNKHGIDKSVLLEWKSKVIDKDGEKIKTWPNKTSLEFHKIVLQQNNPLNTLSDIHNQFVVTPLTKLKGTLHLFVNNFTHLFPYKNWV